MSLPCPICSSVIHGNPGHPVCETPTWRFASNSSRAAGKSMFLWDACKHAKSSGLVDPVATDDRAAIEAKWDVEAMRLFDVRTATWKPGAKLDFGRALGFLKVPETIDFATE